jgi:NAD(P)-dependent dehydrogenase (short-subunit alcohol dehydrogenase family)
MTTESKVAVITGAARGIGLAVAEKFLAEGWRVALIDIDGPTLKAAAAGLNDPARVLALECDVAFAEPVFQAIDRVATHFGRIDALVNNAGTAVFKPLLETSVAEWERVLAVNLTGPFICTQACAPQMLTHGGGSVVNIGSIYTAMAKAVHSADIRADYHDAIPLNRYGLEHEIAAAVWFLCSPQASYINGQTLAVDGGFDATGIGLPSLRRAPA